MILRTLGSVLLVVGAIYTLASASWQVVLLLFLMAGVGFASWRIRKALIRRAKIKALWQRSMKLNAAINSAANALMAESNTTVPASMAVPDTVTDVATRNSSTSERLHTTTTDLKKRIVSLDLSENPIQDTPARSVNARATAWFEETKLDTRASLFMKDMEDSFTDTVSWGTREDLGTMSKGGRVYKFRMSDFSNTTGHEGLNEMLGLGLSHERTQFQTGFMH